MSGDLTQTFNAISDALRARVDIDRIVTTMVLAGRGPHGQDAGEPEPRLGKLETGTDARILGSNRPALRRL